MHAAIELHGKQLMRGETPTLAALERVYNATFDQEPAMRGNEESAERRAAGLATLREWFARNDNSNHTAAPTATTITVNASEAGESLPAVTLPRVPYKVEERFEVPLGGVKLVGVWDRVDRLADGAVVITDYKSGIVGKVPEKRVRESMQLALYATAYERVYGQRPLLVAIESIESGHSRGYAPTQAEVERAERTVAAVHQAVRQEQFQPTPSVSACKYCSYRQVCVASLWPGK